MSNAARGLLLYEASSRGTARNYAALFIQSHRNTVNSAFDVSHDDVIKGATPPSVGDDVIDVFIVIDLAQPLLAMTSRVRLTVRTESRVMMVGWRRFRDDDDSSGTVWFCLVLSDFVWYYLVLSGTVWFCPVLSGTVWFCPVLSAVWYYLLLSGAICCLVLSGIIWYYLVLSGTIWYFLVMSGIVWYYLVLFGTIWYYLVLSGTVWYYAVLSATVWYYVVLSGTVWYYLVLSGTIWYCQLLSGTICYSLETTAGIRNRKPQSETTAGRRMRDSY